MIFFKRIVNCRPFFFNKLTTILLQFTKIINNLIVQLYFVSFNLTNNLSTFTIRYLFIIKKKQILDN